MKAELARKLLEDDKLAKAVCEVFLIAIKRCLENNEDMHKLLSPIKVDDVFPRFQMWLQSVVIEETVTKMVEGRYERKPINGFVSGGYLANPPDLKNSFAAEQIITKEDQRRLIDLIK